MPEDYQSILALLNAFYENQKDNPATNWSWPRIARAMGVSPSTLQNWRQKPEKVNIEKTTVIVANFLQTQLKRDVAPPTIPFKQTRAARIMLDVLQYARIHREFCAVVSQAGYGKTQTIKEYMQQYSDVVLIESRPSQQSHMLLYELAEKVGVSRKNNSDMIFKRIVEKLKDTPKLLVFDEAQFYHYRTLEGIRRIHDTAGVGVLLTGSVVLWDQMIGKDVKDFDQLLSRTTKRELPPLDEDDVRLLLDGVFEGDITDKVVSDMLELCRGSARSLVKNLRVAQTMMEVETVNMDSIRQAHKFLLQAA